MADNPNDKVYAQDQAKAAAKKALDDAKLKAQAAAPQPDVANLIKNQMEAKAAANPEMIAPKVIAHHKVSGDETLSHLSLKYYGHTTEPYWRLIYEFNKAKIGPNYKNIYDGLVLDIPESPAELK
jgi:nucleoid-associated protein YgaU